MHGGIGERRCDVGLHLVDDLGRCLGRHEHSVPGLHRVTRHAGFREGRNVGRVLRATRRRDRQRPHLSRPDRLEEGARGVEHGIETPGEQVVHGARRHAAIRHVRDVDLRHVLEQFGREMRRRSDTRRGVGDLLASGAGDEVLERLCR